MVLIIKGLKRDYVMPNRIFFFIVLCFLPFIANGQEESDITQAKEYFRSGMFYKGLFNTAANRELNYCNAILYLVDNKDMIYKYTGKKSKFSKGVISYTRYYRGLCYYYQGRFKEAITDLQKVDISSDKYLEAQIRLGACYYKEGKGKEAKKIWENLLFQNKKNLLFLSNLGNIYAELGINLTTATVYCQKENEGKIGLIWIYIKNNKIDEALKLTKDIAFESNKREKLEFYDPGFFELKSYVYLNQAVKYYQKAIELKKDDYSCCQLGISQIMCKRINNAIATLQPLINSNKWEVRAETMINLGVAYYLKGLKDDAFKVWEGVIKGYKEKVWVMNKLGYTYSQLEIKLDEVLALCREDAYPYYIGRVYFKKGILSDNIDNIYEATRLLEKGCGNPRGYNPKIDNPSFLLELSNVYYCRRLFLESIQPLMWLSDYYPEVEGVISLTQYMNNVWENILKFRIEQFPNFRIEWKDIFKIGG